jgi:hypothetical protein
MDNTLGLMRGKYEIHGQITGGIRFIKERPLPGDLGYSFDNLPVTIDQIIYNDDLVSAV